MSKDLSPAQVINPFDRIFAASPSPTVLARPKRRKSPKDPTMEERLRSGDISKSSLYMDSRGRLRERAIIRPYEGYHIENCKDSQTSADRRRAMRMASV